MQGVGYHETLEAPYSYISDPNGRVITSNPMPCGWRWMCAITDQGSDGEGPCINVPGCSFWDNTTKVPSPDMHPNLQQGASCDE